MSRDFIGSKVTLIPSWCTKVTSLGEVEMTPLWAVIQSIPSITLMPWEGNTVRSPKNLWPWMSTSTPLHNKIHWISPSGELVIMGIDRVVVVRESLFTNREVTYDPVAQVSKRTKAVVPQTKNSPITTSGASAASSSVRWFSLPRPAAVDGEFPST
jgi:hypothetical protein